MDKVTNFKFSPLLIKNVKCRKGRSRTGRLILRGRRCSQRRKRVNLIDWRRKVYDIPSKLLNVNALATDRTSFIGNLFIDGFMVYYNHLLPSKCNIGDEFISYNKKQNLVHPGDSNELRHMNLGIQVYNVSTSRGGHGKYSRAAGSSTTIFRFLKIRGHEYMGVTLPSGERKYIPAGGTCSLGTVSNPLSVKFEIGSAGKGFRLGTRPQVRGVAMNPVDHPHGGGEGKTTAGGHPVSLWGQLTKGKKTVVKRKKGHGPFRLEA